MMKRLAHVSRHSLRQRSPRLNAVSLQQARLSRSSMCQDEHAAWLCRLNKSSEGVLLIRLDTRSSSVRMSQADLP